MASSPTTMASSTMMPSAMISANRLIMLMLPPTRYRMNSVAAKDTGMPQATQKATRPVRNRYRISTTSTRPPRPLRTSSMMRSRTSSQEAS
jgi:hypothetical protein